MKRIAADRNGSVEITWPEGSREVFDKNNAVDQRLEVRKGEGHPTGSGRAERGNEN